MKRVLRAFILLRFKTFTERPVGRPQPMFHGLLLAVLLVPCDASSQDRWHCRTQLAVTADANSPKHAMSILVEHLQAGDFNYDEDFALLQFGTMAPLTVEVLGSIQAYKPFRTHGTQCISTAGETLTVGQEPFPVRIETGDPIVDDMRYDAAKTVWIATYPALYAQMRSAHENSK